MRQRRQYHFMHFTAASLDFVSIVVNKDHSIGACAKNKLAFWRPNLGQIWPLPIEQNRRNSIDYFEDFVIEERVKPALDSDRGMP